jgi:hypothetical protein
MKMRLLSAHRSIQVLAERRFLPAIATVLLAFLAVLPWRAAGAFFDDFESYAVGSNLIGQGGWAGWAGNASAGAQVSTNFAFSPTRSVNITGASDLVHTFSGATNGQWVFSVRQYIPSTSTGTTYVVLMNTYRPPYGATDLNWSVQIQNNMVTGRIISDLGGSATLPMIKDQWVEDMPSKESSAQRYRRLKVGNPESFKRDHFRPDPVPFDRPLTYGVNTSYRPHGFSGRIGTIRYKRTKAVPKIESDISRPS